MLIARHELYGFSADLTKKAAEDSKKSDNSTVTSAAATQPGQVRAKKVKTRDSSPPQIPMLKPQGQQSLVHIRGFKEVEHSSIDLNLNSNASSSKSTAQQDTLESNSSTLCEDVKSKLITLKA